ncbi:Na+/H+ antiporter NhaA [Sphingomonas sp. RHCKR7]|uniref:Na+/H+ antiporter NhaA n=1 Tax=Sphingomonas folli TaxID=2862497 RepID=UPI001CA58C37|nr:Na+/H+ antiporter NhaA [Sphingomonas folli]MBW6527229.1 Na+/H+ antiporter NhaA [Sphingomonas folli]
MTHAPHPPRPRASALRRFLTSQAAGGTVLIAAAALALLLANSPLAPGYTALLHRRLGPLALEAWVNDALMAVFFLLVGLEIKRETLHGRLASWPRRLLPGIAAAGGMAAPALLYLAVNRGGATQGWAIPAATDIAFALGVVALLGERVPASLRVFLAALAIIDDLGAVLIIALFYTGALALPYLAGAGAVLALLAMLNRAGVTRLSPYLLLGVLLWWLVLRSGVHATLAGVMLAFTIPAAAGHERGPLYRLEHALHAPVAFVILPLFALANAAVPVLGLPPGALAAPVTLGVAAGLLLGKVVGVFGFSALAIRLRLAELPAHAGWTQLLGVALLCGIGFTMSIFITLLAFADAPLLQAEAKLGVLAGSLLAGVAGFVVLHTAALRTDR